MSIFTTKVRRREVLNKILYSYFVSPEMIRYAIEYDVILYNIIITHIDKMVAVARLSVHSREKADIIYIINIMRVMFDRFLLLLISSSYINCSIVSGKRKRRIST